MSNLPSNSQTQPVNNQQVQNIPKAEKAIEGAKVVKKSFIENMKEDAKTVAVSTWKDVIIPSIKDLVVNTLHNIIDTSAYGRDGNKQNNKRTNYTNYTGFSNTNGYVTSYWYGSNNGNNQAPMNYMNNGNLVKDVWVPTINDAKIIFQKMQNRINQYGYAYIQDLYDYAGINDDSHMNYKYAWDNIDKARWEPARGGGFILIFPTPTTPD